MKRTLKIIGELVSLGIGTYFLYCACSIPNLHNTLSDDTAGLGFITIALILGAPGTYILIDLIMTRRRKNES